MSAWRVLIPTWRFFDELGPTVTLQVQLQDIAGNRTEWVSVLKSSEPKWTRIFYNPKGNLRMAFQSVVERAFLEINSRNEASSSDFSESVSYQLLHEIVRNQIEPELAANRLGSYRFRIHVRLPSGETYEALCSQAYGG